MITIISLFILALLLSAARLFLGPTAPDRILAIEVMANITTGLLILFSYLYQKWYLLDIAIVYALLSYVGTLALAKYIRGDL